MDTLFQDRKYRSALALLCAIGWSLAYPLIKLGYSELRIYPADLGSKLLFAGMRFFAAGGLVLLFCVIEKRSLKVTRSEAPKLIVFALVNTSLHYLFSYIGLSHMASSRSTILDAMGGFFLIILSGFIFEDDTFCARKIVGCVLGLLGVMTVSISPNGHFFSDMSFWGDGMILLNACCAAGGGILTRFLSKKMDMMTATGYGMVFGGAVLLIVGVGIGVIVPWNITVFGILILAALTLISAVCFGVYNMLLAYHPISKVAIYNALIPVFGVIFSSVLIGEPFQWRYALAAGFVAAGIYAINR